MIGRNFWNHEPHNNHNNNAVVNKKVSSKLNTPTPLEHYLTIAANRLFATIIRRNTPCSLTLANSNCWAGLLYPFFSVFSLQGGTGGTGLVVACGGTAGTGLSL